MSYSKLKVYYQGDGSNTWNVLGTTSQLEKKITITLPVQAKKYGDQNGYDKIIITSFQDHLILKGSDGQILFDRDVNGEDSNEYITKITRYEWIGEDYVEPKPLNKYTKIKVYHNWQGDGRTLTLPLSIECIEYGDRYGYDNIKVSQTGWYFAMANKEGGTMIYKSFWEADSGVGDIIKIEWLNEKIESEIKKLKNQFTKVRVNHGANSKMTIALPKKLTEFGDRFGYDKITFARKGSTFYLYAPDGFILLRKDCYETGLGEIKSMEWLNDKSEAVPFKPAPAPFEVPVEEPIATPAPTPVSESTPEPAEVSTSTVLYDVVLKSAGKNKLEVIKLVKEECGLGLKEAKDLIDNVPSVVASLARDVANTLKDNLEQLGAKVELLNEKKELIYTSHGAAEHVSEPAPEVVEEGSSKMETDEEKTRKRAEERESREKSKSTVEEASENVFVIVMLSCLFIAIGIYIWRGIDESWNFWRWLGWGFVACLSGEVSGAILGLIAKFVYKISKQKKNRN